MKIIIHIAVILIFALSTQPVTAQEKGKGHQKQEQKGKGNARNNGHGKSKAHPGQGHLKNENRGNGNDVVKENRGNGNNRNKDDRSDDIADEKRNNAKDGVFNSARKNKDGMYAWTPETFRNRNELRKSEKVTICHKFNSDEPAVTISVSSNALKAHMNHGDAMGPCPEIDNTRYTDDYLKKRNDYYNLLQESNEEVTYSRSILDYALSRLASSRLQLADMQSRGVHVEEIQRKQLVVTELEQNVSVLEQLLGVATTLIVNRLAQ